MTAWEHDRLHAEAGRDHQTVELALAFIRSCDHGRWHVGPGSRDLRGRWRVPLRSELCERPFHVGRIAIGVEGRNRPGA